MTAKRVSLCGESSMSAKRMRSPYLTAACRLATAAAPGSCWASSAAVAVLDTSLQQRVRHVLGQPVAALRQRLRLAVDAANLLLLAVGHQVVMNLQPHLGADHQVRHAQEHVERVGDPAVGRVLHRHDAEIDVAAIDLLEDGGDAADAQELDRLAEALDGGEMAVTVFRAEIGDLEHLLQGPRAAHDLAEDGADGGVVERSLVLLVELQDVLQHFLLAGRREDLFAVVVLELADLRRDAGAFVDQLEDLQVEFVDLRAETAQGSLRRAGLSGVLVVGCPRLCAAWTKSHHREASLTFP